MTTQEALDLVARADLPDFLDIEQLGVHSKSPLGDTPLHIACVWGDIEMIAALIEGGADINSLGEYAFTPLQYAIQHDHIDAVRVLLKHGARADLRDSIGDAPADLAKSLGYDHILEIIAFANNQIRPNKSL